MHQCWYLSFDKYIMVMKENNIRGNRNWWKACRMLCKIFMTPKIIPKLKKLLKKSNKTQTKFLGIETTEERSTLNEIK